MGDMERIAILGLGLMGGSLGLALKASPWRGRVVGYARREETRRRAKAMGVCDEVCDDPQEAVRGADLTVLCVPIRAIVALVEACASAFRAGSVVTDVGSTKNYVMQAAGRALAGRPAVFIGSHPMAGSERAGLEAARADLYRGAVVAVTPGGASGEKVAAVRGLWEGLGARVCLMDAAEHDRIVARTSHLPHVAAALVAATAGREGLPALAGWLTGQGFADTTRVADGPAAVWRDVLETNRGPVLEELQALEQALQKFRGALERESFEEVERFLDECRARRQAILAARRDERGEHAP